MMGWEKQLKSAKVQTPKSSLSWLKTRKRILKNIKQRVTKILKSPGKEIELYARQYNRQVSRPWKPSNKQKLIQRVSKSEIVYGADFHAHAQAQRTHLRILRSLPEDKKIVLALECFESQDQKVIDLYMKGKISETDFLKQISWAKKWGFTWQHYQPLVELAKERGYKILGLNKYYASTSRKTLVSRDKHAARILAKQFLFSNDLIYVIFGELHLSKQNLPRQVELALKRKISHVVVFQNVEKVYFDLIKAKKDLTVNVVQFTDDQFCISNSPPWVKWQSYLLFLEKVVEFDSAEEDPTHHAHDLFHQQLELLKSEFQVSCDVSRLSVFGPGDLDPKSLIQSGRLSKSEMAQIESDISNEKSFIIPQFHLVYIARLSLNHISSMAGQWLFISNSGTDRLFWDLPQDFIRLIWLEAISFFCSKILNPGRGLDTLKDISKLILKSTKREEDMLKLCLSFKRFEIMQPLQSKKWSFIPRHRSSYFGASKKLGAMMGEQMFWGYRSGTIRRRLVLDWLKMSPESASFESFFFQVSQELNQLPVIMKSKEERL
jgi:hypothetical protein